MKPISLTLKNIGPFKEQTIDFQELGDFFLICGKTGAGKTTIFDAITYALYGKLPGTRKKVDLRHLRSHFCKPEDEAFVSLNYILKGKSITVKRVLPSLYVNRNGKISEKPEELTIYNNNQQEAIQGKITELNEYIESSIGLTADEFSRIVLLPQGEFAEFLFQNSTQKAETLAKLFPVQKYEDILEAVKDKCSDLNAELKSISELLAGFGAEYNPEEEQKIIDEQETLLEKGNEQLIQLQKQLIELSSKQKDIELIISKHEEEAKLVQKLNEYEKTKDEIQNIQKQLDLAVLVEPVAIACDEAQREQEKFSRVQKDKEENLIQMDKSKNLLSMLGNKASEHNSNIQRQEKISLILPELENAISWEKEIKNFIQEKNQKNLELQDKTQIIEKNKQKKNELKEQLDTLLNNKGINTEALAQKLLELKDNKQKADTSLNQAKEKTNLLEKFNELKDTKNITEKQAEQNKVLLEESKEKLNQLQFNNFARSLSATLQRGKPCPVCGSLEHPAPHGIQLEFENNSDSQYQFIIEENEKLEKNQQNFLTQIAQIDGQLNQIQIQLEVFKAVPDINTAQQIYSQLEKEYSLKETEYNQALENNNKIKQFQTDINELQNEIDNNSTTEIQIQLKEITTKLEEKEKNIQKVIKDLETFNIDTSSIQVSYKTLCDSANELKTQIQSFQNAKQEAEKQFEKNKGLAERLEQELIHAEQSTKDAINRRDEAMNKIGYANIQDLYKARLSSEESIKLKTRLENWKQGFTQTNTLLENIRNELTGTKETTEKQLAQIQNEIATTEKNYQTMNASIKQALLEKEKRFNRLQNWNDHETRRLKLQKEEIIYKQLHSHINGNNPKKIPLTTWILGIYLDEITTYASQRLNRISEGRYTLLMNQENTGGNNKKGLDLEVLDAFTGKTRPCSTLSGGEVFMTSISLALALTDVVSNKAGGISLDALFIDEGFGTLDESSLEKAMSVLDEIRGNRCVGLISHVAEMKNRIPTRLEVIKTSTGSSTRIIHAE